MILGGSTFYDSRMYSLRCGDQNCMWAFQIWMQQAVTEWQNSIVLFSAPFPMMCSISVIPPTLPFDYPKKFTFTCRLGGYTNKDIGLSAPKLLRNKIIDFTTVVLDIDSNLQMKIFLTFTELCKWLCESHENSG